VKGTLDWNLDKAAVGSAKRKRYYGRTHDGTATAAPNDRKLQETTIN
ncbi:uncharacterized protein METZ01_LOCUS217045, partial [marine metagenome]